MLRIEIGLTLVLALIAILAPQFVSNFFEKIEAPLTRLARRRALSVAAVGIAALAFRAALLPIEPVPEPVVHDEFGYLLAADTFSHGRFTNPPHQMWQHFESFSIIQQPTYQCFAQPAQGMILALGKVLLGRPFWGVWLSIAIFCAALTWMLQGWVPEPWALLGGAIAILRFATFSYWANSYWGGAAGAIGGALVLGALPRIRSFQRARDAVIMAVGLGLLANSRPYEGVVFSLPIAVALFAWIFKNCGPDLRSAFRKVVGPISVVLLLIGIGMGCYFRTVTGSPFRMPYQIERETYAVAPYLLWQHPRPVPVYRHAELERMYSDYDVRNFTLAHSAIGVVLFATLKAMRIWSFFIGSAFSLPMIMMLFVLPFGFGWKQIRPTTRFLILELVIFYAGLLAESYFEPHYAAPATCVIIALIIAAMVRLQHWEPNGRRSGAALNRAVVAACVLSFGVRVVAAADHWNLARSQSPAWHELGPSSFGRAALESQLSQLPGQQLVIVHYKPDHDIFDEWVYNDAEIDKSKIVWARDMGAAKNAELVKYFSNRRLWILDADARPPKLRPGDASH